MRIRKIIPSVDAKLLIRDAGKLMPDPMRRNFLRGAASLGALTFLTGCDITDGVSAEQVLMKISRFNDRVQAWLFNPNKLAHDDLTHYNAVQKLLYTGVILTGVVIVLSGLSIWKPVQFQELTALFGGYDIARYVHFFAMASIVGFLAVHITLALLVPKSLRAMVTGR